MNILIRKIIFLSTIIILVFGINTVYAMNNEGLEEPIMSVNETREKEESNNEKKDIIKQEKTDTIISEDTNETNSEITTSVNLQLTQNSNTNQNIEDILSSMTNEEKIALMIMPAFRETNSITINEDNIREVLSTYGYAGVILFGENTKDIESTMRFIDLLQDSNKDNLSRLLICIDQEGGYVTRLGIGTNTIGNMALTATNDPENAYNTAQIIGKELNDLGININFAPVVDVNSNPANPVIGVRSFSDDANTVATYANKFMQGLHEEGIITSLKHFPGHGDTSTDTHTNLSIVYKTYEELKCNELIPFQKLIDNGTQMIMTAHIQFPNIEKETYISKKDNQEYTLPATLSKTFLTDILRTDMGFEGVIITDAFDMDAIAQNFDKIDASIRAINAGADILLMPFTYDNQKEKLKDYVKELAQKIGTEINIENVNSSVRRILQLKKDQGLLEVYDNSNLEENIARAKTTVSTKENHSSEFEIAKKAITMIKNSDNTLPINTEEKTIILYEYTSHIQAISNAIAILKQDGNTINENNISVYPFYENGKLPLDKLKQLVTDAKNVIMIHSLYDSEGLKDTDLDLMNELIDYIHQNNGKVILLSTQLPYDVAKFREADAIVLTYLANGIRFNLDDYTSQIPKYGPNVIAGIYMLFTNKNNLNGVLPVNIYNLDSNNNYTNEILYNRGFGLKYLNEDDSNDNSEITIEEIINIDDMYNIDNMVNYIRINNPYTNDSIILYVLLFGISVFVNIGLIINRKETKIKKLY